MVTYCYQGVYTNSTLVIPNYVIKQAHHSLTVTGTCQLIRAQLQQTKWQHKFPVFDNSDGDISVEQQRVGSEVSHC